MTCSVIILFFFFGVDRFRDDMTLFTGVPQTQKGSLVRF